MEQNKDIILFVGKYITSVTDSIKKYNDKHGVKYKTALLYDKKKPPKIIDSKKEKVDFLIPCNLTSMIDIQTALKPYQDRFLAVTCRGEDQIQLFSKVIPYIPYLRTPSSESLLWSSDKLLMRRRLYNHNKKISPKYTVVSDISKRSIKRIGEKVGFPLIVKPSGLAGSRLVTICYHKEELEKTLKNVFRKIKVCYKKTGGNWEPKVLVEQFMEGDMYSIDAYVNSRGKAYFCPMVYVTTGRQIGFDDFFGYKQISPPMLKPESTQAARETAKEAIHALGLKNTVAHIEMMRTEKGWKIIELGARVGGFRHSLYSLTYGIDHNMNDILIRIPKKPIIPRKRKGYAVAMKFFAKKEGRLKKLKGIRNAQKLKSFIEININKKIGDRCTFAKNGGLSVFNIIMFNSDRSKLLADIRRLEQFIKIET